MFYFELIYRNILTLTLRQIVQFSYNKEGMAMKQRLKRIVLLAIVIVLAVLGVNQIIKGIQEAVAYYERHDKYVTVEGEVRNVYRFGLGYTASISYDYKGGHSTYLEKRIGIAPKEGDIVKLQVDSFYSARVRPSSNGILRILVGMMILAAIGYFIYGYKNHKYDGISINISPKVKKGIRIAGVIMVAWIVVVGVDVLVSSFFDARDDEWGLKLSVSDVSSKGLTLHLERDDSKHEETLTYGSGYLVEKRTLIGWKLVNAKDGYFFTAEGYWLENIDSKSQNINLEGKFGRLSMGIYRIRKTTMVDGYFRCSEDEREGLDQELYATFVVLW